ncbi:hypothetical protein CC86DRAFT_400440 [Ophiobolus disseminans]|uniref:DUF7918 domain-containing protein n=1 Tax=Ophiobolus disseminans TaxID=1469910 RepID=A0A6A7AMI4_9PLEO|nr:hypothetical protein CC86DRAFT_400440 [Ophiobolus disseminans]
MTTCDQHPGMKAEIIVDYEPLQEYDDDEAEPGVVSKYVEAASGKEFAIKFTFTRPFPTQHGVEIKVSVDGEPDRVLAYSPEELCKAEGHYKRGVGFQKDGQFYRQNYRFTALNIVEEADGLSNVTDLRKDLLSKGSIKLEYRFIANIHTSDEPRRYKPASALSTMGAIPEKALKGDARSHQATLSEPRRARARKPLVNYNYVNREPFTTIVFKYRSLTALKALRIIDEDEEDPTLVEDRAEDAMTPAQLREVLRLARRREAEASQQLKQERSGARTIKRERAETFNHEDDDDEVTIVESRSRKRPRGEPEVIILD